MNRRSLARVACLIALVGAVAAQSLELEISADNSPVYAVPRQDAQQVAYTVHRGAKFPVLETRRVGESDLFYRIRYGQRESDTGWVHADRAQIRKAAAPTAAAAAGAASTPDALYTRISHLVDAYNDEKAALTVEYGLHPFPSFTVDLTSDSAAKLLTESGTIRVPLAYAHEGKLALQRSSKFLVQLIMRECFAMAPPPAQVEVTIRFTSGSFAALAYRADDWDRQGRGGLEEFWNGIAGAAKNAIW